MTLQDIANIAIIIGSSIGAITLIFGILEFTKQGALKRAEYFSSMRDKFKENENITKLFDFLEKDDPKLSEISYSQKVDFIGFYEEIALMVNSKLVKKRVAHYMFSYFALRCWDSKNFWSNINRDSMYWIVFKEFVLKMKEIENKKSPKMSKYRI